MSDEEQQPDPAEEFRKEEQARFEAADKRRYRATGKPGSMCGVLGFMTAQDQYELILSPGDIIHSDGETVWLENGGGLLVSITTANIIDVLLRDGKIFEQPYRAPGEIVERIEEVKGNDFFGVECSNLIARLPFGHAKPYLKDGVTEEGWEVERKTPGQEIAGYMEFAWGKANDNRGLSAARSLSHMMAWLWLDHEVELAGEIGSYSHYGKPQLVEICRRYGIDWQQYDDGRWTNDETSDGVKPGDVIELTEQEEARAREAAGVTPGGHGELEDAIFADQEGGSDE